MMTTSTVLMPMGLTKHQTRSTMNITAKISHRCRRITKTLCDLRIWTTFSRPRNTTTTLASANRVVSDRSI